VASAGNHGGRPIEPLVAAPEDQAAVAELAGEAAASAGMARLREVVAFVGRGRVSTQAGNLKAADAMALARRLAPGEQLPDEVRSMEDLPDVAHTFRWAAAAEFLARRGTKVVAGPRAPDLELDPLSAWFRAVTTLLDHGPLDGFRQGWRKSYVTLIDENAAGWLVAMAGAGGATSLTALEAGAWAEVVESYGYEPDDDDERRHVAHLVGGLVAQLADVGVVRRGPDGRVVLTELGVFLATLVAFASDDDDSGEVDLVDTDALSLLMVCAEEIEPGDVSGHLRAWCQARPAEEAAEELCLAILDDDDRQVWKFGLEALAMVDRSVAEPAVRGLLTDARLRPMATTWLRRHGGPPHRGGR
jgi:hypothetical protein